MVTNFKKSKTTLWPLMIFIICLATRILFKLFSGASNYELFQDSYRYTQISDQLIQGHWAMDVNAYVIAPLYPMLLALIKWIGGDHWEIITLSIQFTLVSLSAVWLFKLSRVLLHSNTIALITALIYIFYPLTLWYNFTLVQETLFQSLFIGVIYYLYDSWASKSNRSLYIASLLFGLSLLTKSHILISIPFFAYWVFKYKSLRQLCGAATVVVCLCLPTSIINYTAYGIISLSSAGSSTLFLLGHSDLTYPCIISTAGEKESFHAQGCDADFVFQKNYNVEPWHTINSLPPAERFKSRKKEALKWIRNNPHKFAHLKWHGLKRFFIPGLDWNQYQFKIWLPALLMGIAIYVPAFMILLKSKSAVDPAFKNLVWILVITILIIFLAFFPINRFRVITIEPILIILAGKYYGGHIKKWLQNRNFTAIT